MVSALKCGPDPGEGFVRYRVAGVVFSIGIRGGSLLSGAGGGGTDWEEGCEGVRSLIRSPWEESFLLPAGGDGDGDGGDVGVGVGARVDVELEVVQGAGREGQNLQVEEVEEGRLYRLTRWDFELEFDLSSMCCRGRLGAGVTSLDGVVLSLLGVMLPLGGGLLLHSCGLVNRGKGFLFLGPSGAGKSTIGRLWGGGGRTLNDELCVAASGGDGGAGGNGRGADPGHGGGGPGSWKLYSTPYVGQSNRIPSTAGEGSPLGILAFISHGHGPKTRIREISGGRALTALLERVFCPLRTLTMAERLMGSGESLIRSVPAMELEVSLEDGIWGPVYGFLGESLPPWGQEEIL